MLDVALDLFRRGGYHGTTMEGLAAAADVSKATLYKYFADKDELCVALVRERRLAPDRDLIAKANSALQRTLVALENPEGGTAEIEEAILELLLQTGRSDAFFRLVMEIGLEQPRLVARLRKEALGLDHSARRRAATPSPSKTPPPDLDAEALSHLLHAVVTGYTVVQQVVLGDERLPPERLARALVTLLSGALTARPATSGS